jgi:ribosomal protection tetracycline resistance protein
LRTLNLGILAHVDAGKTSLTERLLHDAGVIAEIGSVDSGSTQTDTMALERRRGITIKAAVVAFTIGDLAVNLIDTPGHPDFIAEVERVLGVLDGAVLVVSAVEGVQAQTRVLMRTLRRLGIPTLLFANKVDRSGAVYEPLLASISERLAPAIVPMGTVERIGEHDAACRPLPGTRPELVEALAEHDDALLGAYLDGEAVASERLRHALADQTRRGLVHPVYFGSAITGAGVGSLSDGIKDLLPASDGDPGAPVSGTVFKIERGPAGEKIAYVRLFAGTLRVRDRVRLGTGEAKVTALGRFARGTAERAASASAGQIATVWGLDEARIGDVVGEPPASRREGRFAPPTLETVVTARDAADKGALHAALSQLAEQDPLIDLRRDEVRGEVAVSLYGEVQKEVVESTLADEYGIDVDFSATTVICVERPVGSGEALEILGKGENPFTATVGLRVDPAPPGSGVSFRLGEGVKIGDIPIHVFKTVEDFEAAMETSVRRTLQEGLRGWEVVDCAVTMTRSGFISPSTRARDFRLLIPLVLMEALERAGTVVCEPMHHFSLEVPHEVLGPVLAALAKADAVPEAPKRDGRATVVEGAIPAASVHGLEQRLPKPASGEAMLEYGFDHYRPVRGAAASRARSGVNPLNRKEYLSPRTAGL